mgnify:CR=1 FL=1
MMSDVEMRKLAHYIVLEAREDEELLVKVAKMLQKSGKTEQRRNVNAKVAADMLGISVRQLRRIKDSFSYMKTGTAQQAGIMFNANTLHEEYDAYIASRQKTFQIKPLKVATG